MAAFFLIQGIFFYRGALGALESEMFYGVIQPDPMDLTSTIGIVHDKFGESTLTNVVMHSNSRLSFTKQYKDQEEKIEYSFRKESGNIYAGEYSGNVTGKERARCVLTQISQDFFSPFAPPWHSID